MTVSRYALNLPAELKQAAEDLASQQGVSLNQFIIWAVAEKVGELRQKLDDPAYTRITYRRTASGRPAAVLRGTNLHVRSIATAARDWQLSPEEIAEQYELQVGQVREALAFYDAHRSEIDVEIAADQAGEAAGA